MPKRSIFLKSSQKMFFMGKTTLSFPVTLPPQKRKLFCLEIHGLPFYRPSQVGIWKVIVFPTQTAFQYVRLLKRRPVATWFSRFARVRCFAVFVYNRNFVKFRLQLWRYGCVTETWLLWAAAMWSSNGANDVCSSFNFAAASLWDKQGSRKANNIIRLAWISNALKGIRISLVMAGGAFPPLLVPQ